jgi:hypothetical protein
LRKRPPEGVTVLSALQDISANVKDWRAKRSDS